MARIPRKRRSTTLDERLTPCEACGYVLSQRHHLLPAARYGESEHTVHLCANCHEAYHALEAGWIDERAGRKNTHAQYLYGALWKGYGGRDNPVFEKLCTMIQDADVLRERSAESGGIFGNIFEVLFGSATMEDLPVDTSIIRRGDTVRLTDGTIARVVSTAGGHIHTTKGTYGPWQVVKIGTTPRS